jgi:Rrf2 family cysteine metabolism transcriptional repressor
LKISTRGRYGLRLLVDLCEHKGEGPIALGVVAKRQKLSEKYLQQVALLLTRGGFLNSVKGSGGGYLLSRDPSKIFVYDVLDLLEGSITLDEPGTAGDTAIEEVIRIHFYQPLDREISRVFDGLTLEEVTEAEWFSYSI